MFVLCAGIVRNVPIHARGKNLNPAARAILGTIISDALISITTLILGILAFQGTIDLPLSAAYSLIGVSSFITLTWIIFAAIKRKEGFQNIKKLFQASISSNPEAILGPEVPPGAPLDADLE